MITGADVVAEARSWLDTRYHHGAHLKGVDCGCDCIGLIVGVGIALGIAEAPAFLADPAYRGYSPHPLPALLIEACDKYLDRVLVSNIRLGDIPVMVYDKAPQHFGIISSLDPRYLIHAYAPTRKVAENRIDEAGARRILRVYRFRGIG